MTIPELKVVVKGLERNLEEAKKELREAMIAACPLRVGDYVLPARYGLPRIKRIYWHSIHQELWADFGLPGDDPIADCRRIDEHGNVLPPRGEGE